MKEIFKIDVKTLLDLVTALKEITEQAGFNVSKEGLIITEFDPANVCVVDISLMPSKFNNWFVETPKTYGIILKDLYNLLKENKKQIVSVFDEDTKLILKFDNGIQSELELITIESEQKRIPELTYKTSINLKSERFKEIIKHFKANSEKVILEVTTKFKVYTTGNNKSEIELTNDEATVHGTAKCYYSTEYLSKFIKVIFADKLWIRMDTDFPIALIQEKNGLSVKYILGPRIENTE